MLTESAARGRAAATNVLGPSNSNLSLFSAYADNIQSVPLAVSPSHQLVSSRYWAYA